MRKRMAIGGLVMLLSVAAMAQAGLYTDDMSRCLVAASTKEDKVTLMRWMFMALSKNPAISSLSKTTDTDIDKANAAVGALVTRLLTQDCLDKSKLAIKYEGGAAIQTSFAVLGQVAAAELLSDPDVGKVMSGLDKYIDKQKLESLKDSAP